MNSSFYTAAVGAYMQNQRMNVQGNNLANVNNYGFKAERATFHHLMYGNVLGIDAEELPRGSGTKMVKASVDFEQGGVIETGRTFDFAINGDGFFALYDPSSGEISFTRDGAFMMARIELEPPGEVEPEIDPETGEPVEVGPMFNPDIGLWIDPATWEPIEDGPVYDPEAGQWIDPETGEALETGPVYDRETGLWLDPETGEELKPPKTEEWRLSDNEGRFVLDSRGDFIVIDLPLDRFAELDVGVFDYRVYDGMQHLDSQRFMPIDKNGDLYVGTGTVMRGFIERSNTDATQEMIKVIESQRAYSYALKMVQTSDEIEQTINNLPN